MPLFREKHVAPPASEAEPAATLAPGIHLLYDGPILAAWFALYRLEQEIERARRYGSCLSVLVAEPQLFVGETVLQSQRLAAAEAASKSARTTDLVGWLGETNIVVILPEAEAASARFAATRCRDEIWLLSHAHGNQKWQVTLVDELDEIEALLKAATTPQQRAA